MGAQMVSRKAMSSEDDAFAMFTAILDAAGSGTRTG
jgi:hypothetical protein